MIKWFREIAPIREKMLVLVVCATGLVAIASIASMVGHIFGGPLWGTISAMPVVVVTAVLGLSARRHICDPYVTTVVRMEALAAGDLTSPILFTDFSDCVGRLTRGMFTFRDAAEREIHQSQQRSAFVSTLGHHLSKLSEGDLTATIVADFPDEYAALKSNFNEALEKLSELIGAVSESTATIRIGSGEIAQASEDLARRTESNAASLEETAASVTQMDGRLKASSQAATRTVERADQAIVTVGDGRAVADDAVAAMGRVSDSAKGIDSVIEGLDKIASRRVC